MAQLTQPKRSALRFFGQIVLTIALVAAGAVAFRYFLGPRASLQRVLDAETDALNNVRQKEFLALQDQGDVNWWNMRRSLIEQRAAARKEGEEWAVTPEPRRKVTAAEVDGPHAWAQWESDLDGSTRREIEFFVQREGEWLHSAPDPYFWGEPRTAASEHLTWTYRERDEEWVRQLMNSAEPLYAQMSTAFGLPAASEQLTVAVRYDSNYDWPLLNTVDLETPLLAGYDVAEANSYFAYLLAEQLALRVAGVKQEQLSTGSQALLHAVADYQAAQVLDSDGPADRWHTFVSDALAEGRAIGLQQVWPAGEPATPWSPGEMQLRYVLAYTLIDFIAERYGADRLPALLRALGGAETIDQVLVPVLNVDVGTIEAEWLAFLRERYGPGTQP